MKAQNLHKQLSDNQVVVTGPPVDPRIVACRRNRPSTIGRPLRIAISTGGIGSNKSEITAILNQLPTADLTQGKNTLQLLLNASTHQDFYDLFLAFANHLSLPVGRLEDPQALLRVIYRPTIDAINEDLVNYVFPWADLIVTKPSGDFAYDAAAAGIPCLFLSPLGPWEENIQARFLFRQIAYDLEVNRFKETLDLLNPGWLDQASQRLQKLPSLFTHGSQNILKAYLSFAASL